MNHIEIRPATLQDVPHINKILNHAILNTNYNLQENARSLPDAEKWYNQHISEGYPVIVAVTNNTVVGWASLSHFRSFSGYDSTAEVSVYVSISQRHKGIGSLLLSELERVAKFHMLIAVITDNNTASLTLHSRCGFVPMCTFNELGRKNGEYLSITFMTKKINKYGCKLFSE